MLVVNDNFDCLGASWMAASRTGYSGPRGGLRCDHVGRRATEAVLCGCVRFPVPVDPVSDAPLSSADNRGGATTPGTPGDAADTEADDIAGDIAGDTAADTPVDPPSATAGATAVDIDEANSVVTPAGAGLPERRRTSARWPRLTLPGAWVALAFVCLSFTPTLLPRPAFFQGFVCGVNGVIGYSFGVLGAWLWRQFADRPARPARPRSWRAFLVAAPVIALASYLLGLRWQLQIRELMSVPPEGFFPQLLLPLIAAVMFLLLLTCARGVRALFRAISNLLARRMGRRAARGIGAVLVAAATGLLVSGVLVDGAIGIADRSFATLDTTTGDTAVQPTTPLRSGGPQSEVPWNTLGFQGRNFIGTGPTAAQISALSGTAAQEPIRAYAGIATEQDPEQRAAMAVADLDRAGGFGRRYLLVAGTTGTGWVDPGAVDSLEYLTDGDVATVAIQYSYLPSWVSFIVDQSRARAAGRALFDAVYERWSQLAPDARPRLLVFGVSLGSFSGETAFSGEFDLRNRTSGALFAGPPNFNTLFREFTDGRDAGSPEEQPVFRDGRTVRFTATPDQPISPVDAPWDGTRVLYLAHPSDPIIYWSPDLILRRPDWLTEPPGADVLDEMVWIPVVTFWQVTADMLEPVPVPQGHGHVYEGQYVDGWAAVIQPPGWTPAKAAQLRAVIIDEY